MIPAFHEMDDEMLGRFNSATKYPSIDTYHEIGSKGRLSEARTCTFDGPVVVTEKIDGTNARIILSHDAAPVIGTREGLLHYWDDVLANPELGIVDALSSFVYEGGPLYDDYLKAFTQVYTVIFGEVFGRAAGGPIGQSSKNYTTVPDLGFRVFDVATIPREVLKWDRAKISSWRQHGGQEWSPDHELAAVCKMFCLPRVPVLCDDPPPAELNATMSWLESTITTSQVRLNDTARGRPEGVVVRNLDRSAIAKIRYADYTRTLGVTQR